MDIEFVIRGTSALLCHNPQMVDPNFEINREIKKLTGKRKKTDEDNKEIERLEWLGGIYTGVVGGKMVITQPTSKLRKCLIHAARITKQGKSIERALIMTELNTRLIYDGSEKAGDIKDELDRLINNPAFHSRLSVVIGGRRIMRVRPQFLPWALVVRAMFITDAGLNFETLADIVTLAGQAERIGDNRVNGYGAFVGVVREITPTTKPIDPTLSGVEKFMTQHERKAA